MIVPTYWAEGRARSRTRQKQITVRRFGWSDVSQEDAQARADERAKDALARAVGGEDLLRREPKLAYNGAEGVPIREEIVDRFGETIVTRNLYGARCINTPNVLFADVDFVRPISVRLMLSTAAVMVALSIGIAVVVQSAALGYFAGIASLVFAVFVAAKIHRLRIGSPDQAADRTRDRVAAFVRKHPNWRARLYRTPAGMRVLAMHRTYDPVEPEVDELFAALDVDPLYARMCRNQRCFRARVSAKPWRIGIASHMKPRPGVWPVRPDRMAERARWIDEYERAAQRYSACRFLEEVGSGNVDPRARAVATLHDELSRATSSLALA